MTNMKIRTVCLTVLLSVAFAIVSCASPRKADTRAADAAALQALDQQWSATAEKKDVDRTVAFYADDAVLLPPNAPIATDRDSIRESWASLLSSSSAVAWKPSHVEVAASGDLGYIYGTYTLTAQQTNGAPSVHDIGKFVEIWKKQADGNWKCVVDTYNSDLAATPAPKVKSMKSLHHHRTRKHKIK